MVWNQRGCRENWGQWWQPPAGEGDTGLRANSDSVKYCFIWWQWWQPLSEGDTEVVWNQRGCRENWGQWWQPPAGEPAGEGDTANSLVEGEGDYGFAAEAFGGVAEGQRTAMGFGDLAAEHQADAGAAAFGGEEGDEEVGGVG